MAAGVLDDDVAKRLAFDVGAEVLDQLIEGYLQAMKGPSTLRKPKRRKGSTHLPSADVIPTSTG